MLQTFRSLHWRVCRMSDRLRLASIGEVDERYTAGSRPSGLELRASLFYASQNMWRRYLVGVVLHSGEGLSVRETGC